MNLHRLQPAADPVDAQAPLSSVAAHDVTGSINDSSGTHAYTSKTLFTQAEDLNSNGGTLSLYSQSSFLSAIWPAIPGATGLDLTLSFGTDSSLTVGNGWDHATGWGEPNGMPFIQGVTGKTTGAVVKK